MPKFLSTTVLVSWLVIGNLCQSFETSGEPTRSGRPLKGGIVITMPIIIIYIIIVKLFVK